MVELPTPQGDPTLLALDKRMEAADVSDKFYGKSVGMGVIGGSCSRKIWYDLRLVKKTEFAAKTLRIFEDGHASEDQMAKRLRLVPGVTLITDNPETGKQIRITDVDGHFKGFLDGEILGILQAPKTWHVWEHKSVNEEKFDKLLKLVLKDEKAALAEWDPVYYAQAVLYMYYRGFTRHYMTVTTPGGRAITSCRTKAHNTEAKRLIKRAEQIIKADQPPPRPFTEDYFECKWCDFKEQCHFGAWSDRNCRTCLHSSAAKEGRWHCAKWDDLIPRDIEPKGCASHLYIPDLVAGEQTDAGEDWVEYKLKDGSTWRDNHEHPATDVSAGSN